MSQFYDLEAKNIDGETVSMGEYKDQVLLIVNVASKCGFTNQYEGLQAIYEKFKDQGFTVLGFPCNQFGAQEPGDESEIKSFCSTNYGVSFPMFSKVDVNGENEHAVYEFLKREKPGLAGTKAIKWNFTKFLVDKNGNATKRFAPKDKPAEIEKEIESLLS